MNAMDQMLVDTAVRRLKAKNTKEVTLQKTYFSDLLKLTSANMNSLASFNPVKTKTEDLRASYMPLYRWLAVQLTDLYEFSVEPELLSRLKVSIDLGEGTVEVQVVLTHLRKDYKFIITFNDELAPYTTKWAAALTKVGSNGDRFKQMMQLV